MSPMQVPNDQAQAQTQAQAQAGTGADQCVMCFVLEISCQKRDTGLDKQCGSCENHGVPCIARDTRSALGFYGGPGREGQRWFSADDPGRPAKCLCKDRRMLDRKVCDMDTAKDEPGPAQAPSSVVEEPASPDTAGEIDFDKISLSSVDSAIMFGGAVILDSPGHDDPPPVKTEDVDMSGPPQPVTETEPGPVTEPGPSHRVFLAPPAPGPYFVQRPGVLDAVLDMVRRPSHHRGDHLIVLEGLPGCGKSNMALGIAHAAWERLPSCSVFYVCASSPCSLEVSLCRIATALGAPLRPGASVCEVVDEAVSRLDVGTWLFIVDAGNGTGIEAADDHDLWAHLPWSSRGSVLVTTQDRENGVMLGAQAGSFVNLSSMTASEAMALWHRGEPLKRAFKEADVAGLLASLGHHPLAIVRARELIRAKGLSLGQYMEMSQAHQVASAHPRSNGAVVSLMDRLDVMFDFFCDDDDLAWEILCLSCYLDTPHVPLALLPTPAPWPEMKKAVDSLRDQSLLVADGLTGALTMHRAVQTALRFWLQHHDLHREAVDAVMAQLARTTPSPMLLGGAAAWSSRAPNLAAVLRFGHHCTDTAAHLTVRSNLALGLWAAGRMHEAQAELCHCLHVARASLGPGHLLTVTCVEMLGLFVLDRTKDTPAEPRVRQALLLRQQLYGHGHPVVSPGHSYLTAAAVRQEHMRQSHQQHWAARKMGRRGGSQQRSWP